MYDSWRVLLIVQYFDEQYFEVLNFVSPYAPVGLHDERKYMTTRSGGDGGCLFLVLSTFLSVVILFFTSHARMVRAGAMGLLLSLVSAFSRLPDFLPFLVHFLACRSSHGWLCYFSSRDFVVAQSLIILVALTFFWLVTTDR